MRTRFDPARAPRVRTACATAFERVFIALHGRYGEDGTVQGALELMGIPYTGSGVMASALAMDKWRTKLVWQAAAFRRRATKLLTRAQRSRARGARLGLPLIVKPAHEGSSIGMTKVRVGRKDRGRYALAANYDALVIAEEFIDGRELTAAVLGERGAAAGAHRGAARHLRLREQVLQPTTRATTARAACRPTQEARMQALVLRAFDVLGCRGWGRVDLMLRRRRQALVPRR